MWTVISSKCDYKYHHIMTPIAQDGTSKVTTDVGWFHKDNCHATEKHTITENSVDLIHREFKSNICNYQSPKTCILIMSL